MRPALWRLFLDLAEEGSMSRVALQREMAQPQLSRQLAELEALCGQRLFTRHARGLQLSAWGQWVLPLVRQWLSNTEQLEADIRAGAGMPVGQVQLACMPSAMEPLLCPALVLIGRRYPLVRVKVQEGLDASIQEGLDAGRYDMAIRYVDTRQLQPRDQMLQQVDSFLVGPPGDSLTKQRRVPFSALRGLDLILPSRHSRWRESLDRTAREHGFELNVTLEADSLILQRQMVRMGAGYTILGPLAIASQDGGGEALQTALIVEPEIPRAVALTIGARTPNPAQRAVAQAIDEVARALPAHYFNRPLRGRRADPQAQGGGRSR
jgi:DNA-binding transcriptional LysR family regulator